MPINSGSSTSPGVYTGERDNSVRATAPSTSVGAIVGPSHKGPVGEPILVTDEEDFIRKFGNADISLTYMHYCARAFLQESSRLYVIRVAKNALLGGLAVKTENNFSKTENLSNGLSDEEDIVFGSKDIMVIYGANPGRWNNNISVLMYPDTDDPEDERFFLEVFEGSAQVPTESFRATIREKKNGFGDQIGIEYQTEEFSEYIRVMVNENHEDLVNNPALRLINSVTQGEITQGSSGDPVNESDIMEGWNGFSDPEEVSVNILINAGYTAPSIQLNMLQIAEDRYDSFAVLDLPSREQATQDAINFRRNTLNANTSFGALYGPDVKIRDTREARDVWIPPSGHVAGAFAYTDRVSAAWFAPAGLNRGQLNVLGLRETYRQGDRDALFENQINPIRVMRGGQGIVLWGAETLQSFASALSNINVRRLILLLQNAISDAALVAVFDPNDEFLRLSIRNMAEGVLNPIQQGRGLYGFEVIVDDRNNTPETIANGDLIVDVYVDPVIPAKRIHLNAIIPKTGQIQFAQDLING